MDKVLSVVGLNRFETRSNNEFRDEWTEKRQ
jgi:hypothetical protein